MLRSNGNRNELKYLGGCYFTLISVENVIPSCDVTGRSGVKWLTVYALILRVRSPNKAGLRHEEIKT